MNKVLTLCVPAYNMEKYLKRCIDSLIDPSIIDNLEIIIVNDGSKDKTLSIANEYKAKFPNSIIVLDKQNGHYGSCINVALEIASGKYFRILDADDWFDPEALKIAVERLSNLETDVYFTKCMIHDFGRCKQIPRKYTNIVWNRLLNLDTYRIPDCVLSMHSLTYRTKLLKDIKYVQTEGICYTDTEYVYYPLCQAKALFAENIFLYQYYIGREEQSMSLVSLERNMLHSYPLIRRFCSDRTYVKGNINSEFIHNKFVSISATQLFLYSLLFFKENKELDKTNKLLLEEIRTRFPEEYKVIYNLKALGIIPYIKLWIEFPLVFKFFRFVSMKILIHFI